MELQRYYCNDCKRTFTKVKTKREPRKDLIREALHLFIEGYTLDEVNKCLGLSYDTAENWRNKYLRQINKIIPETRSRLIHKGEYRTVYIRLKSADYDSII